MPYCTQSQLEERFGLAELVQITNHEDPAATTVHAGRVARAVEDIDALIDAKLAGRYALPLASVPNVLRNLANDLVRARLFEERITEHVANREKFALKVLDEIATGKVQLGLDLAGNATPTTDGAQAEGQRVFSRATLADYAG